MPYNDNTLLKDASGTTPINQFFNVATDNYEAVEGSDGASKVQMVDGADIAIGTKADAVAGSDLTQEWTLISIYKAVVTELRRMNGSTDISDGITGAFGDSTLISGLAPMDFSLTGGAAVVGTAPSGGACTITITNITTTDTATLTIADAATTATAAGFPIAFTQDDEWKIEVVANGAEDLKYRLSGYGGGYNYSDGIVGAASNSTLMFGLAPRALTISSGAAVAGTGPSGGDLTITLNNVTQATSAVLTIASGATTSTSAGFPLAFDLDDEISIVLAGANGAANVKYRFTGVA